MPWTWIWFVLFWSAVSGLVRALFKIMHLQDRVASLEVLAQPQTTSRAQPPTTPRVARPQSRHAQAALQDARWLIGETGEAASFTYTDADGIVTDREVRNWSAAGPHVKGFCLMARANRTFRKDRIEDWTAHGG